MDPAQPADDNPIMHRNVASQRRPVRNHTPITNPRVVPNMGVGHEEILIADDG
jgi:hypothetical protein